MYCYVVGTSRNPLNKKAIIGFYVWDGDTKSNNTILLSQTKLKQLINDNAIKVANISLNEKTNKLESSTTNLQGLSYTFGDESTLQYKYCVIDYNADGTTKLCKCNLHSVEVCDVNSDELNRLRELEKLVEKKLEEASSRDNAKSINIREAYIRSTREAESNQVKNQSNNSTDTELDSETLERQAKDVNIYWNMKQFDRYMKNHKWKYSLTKVYEGVVVDPKYNPYYNDVYSIDSIDENCEVVHLPVECIRTYKLFKSKPKCRPTLIFSPMMTEINGLYPIDEDKYSDFEKVTNVEQFEIISGKYPSLKELKTGNLCTKWNNQKLFDEIAANYTGNVIVENIYFQRTLKNKLTQCQIGGLCLIDITGVAQLPCCDNLLRGYNGCNINNIEIKGLSSVTNSFNRTKFKTSKLDIDVNIIQSSFKTFGMVKESTVNLCEAVERIQDSFNDTDVHHFEFSQATKLNTINKSFCKCINLKVLDVSMLEGIRDILNSLKNCESLEEFKLPQKLHTIGDECLAGTPGIKELVIPESIKYIVGSPSGNGCDVVYPNKVQSIRREYFRGFHNALQFNPIFTSTISCIETPMESVSGHIKDLKLPKTINKLCPHTFSYSHLSVFDSQYLPLVSYIADSAFEYSHIEEVIFRDNITKLGDNLFSMCTSLKKVVIDSSVQEIGSIFKGIATDTPVSVYVVKGSYASKKFRNSSKLVVIQVNSIEEAFDIDNETPDSKQAKFDMMLHGTEYEKLLIKEFRQYAGFNYKLLESIKNNTPYMETQNMQLDVSKYVYKPLSIIPKLKEFVYTVRDMADKELKSDTREFISLSNLITKISDNYLDRFNDDIINKFAGNRASLEGIEHGNAVTVNDVKDNIILIEQDAMIFKTKIKEYNIVKGTKVESNLAYVIIMIYKDNIVWMTPFGASSNKFLREIGIFISRSIDYSEMSLFKQDISNWYGSSDYFYLTSKINRDEKLGRINVALGNVLIPGDVLSGMLTTNSFGTIIRINGKDIPYSFSSRVESNIRLTCKVIGIKDFEKKYNRWCKADTELKKSNIKFEVMLFDVLNQKFVLCACSISFKDSMQIINSMTMKYIVDVMDIDKALTKYKSHLETFVSVFSNTESSNKLLSILTTDEAKQAIVNDMSNYDTKGNMNISYVAELVYTNNIKTLDDILNNKKILQRVLDSRLYIDANISLNQIKNNDNCYRNILLKTVENGDIVLEYNAKITDGGDAYFITLASPTSNMNSKKLIRRGMLDLSSTVQLLYIIGQNRASGENKATARIDDNTININDFYTLTSRNLPGFTTYGCKVLIVMDKYNSDTYMVGEQWDSDFVKVFRFRDPIDGYRMLQTIWQSDNGNIRRTLRDLIMSIISGVCDYSCKNNILYKLREEIKKGLPNNYIYNGNIPKDIVDLLAKQPKNNK